MLYQPPLTSPDPLGLVCFSGLWSTACVLTPSLSRLWSAQTSAIYQHLTMCPGALLWVPRRHAQYRGANLTQRCKALADESWELAVKFSFCLPCRPIRVVSHVFMIFQEMAPWAQVWYQCTFVLILLFLHTTRTPATSPRCFPGIALSNNRLGWSLWFLNVTTAECQQFRTIQPNRTSAIARCFLGNLG